MSFDEQPDGDIHEECAAEIHNLQRQLAESQAREVALREALQDCETFDNWDQLEFHVQDTLRDIAHADDTALREWCAKLLEGVANEGEQWILEEAAAIRKEGFRQ